jgi:hypothetical protein
VVVGDWIVDEPDEELLELLDELLECFDEPDELFAARVLKLPVLELPVLELPVLEDALLLAEAPDDALVFDDAAGDFTAACVDPGRAMSTAPATPTLARDTVAVVVFRRRLPRSRSATARAISLLFILASLARPAVRPI